MNRICELVHSLDSESAARRLEVPALVQVNLAGEESKGGVAPAELGDVPRRYGVRGLSTMPPAAATPEDSRDWFRRLRELAGDARPGRALDGDDAGLPRRRRGGRDLRPGRQRALPLAATEAPVEAVDGEQHTRREAPSMRERTRPARGGHVGLYVIWCPGSHGRRA